MNERWFKKKYLVYELGQCEQGSEGLSAYYGYAICTGDTIEEVMEDYKKQVNELYGQNIHPKNTPNGWTNYYRLAYNELPDVIYGHTKKLNIE